MLQSQIESVLFISNKPLSIKELADLCNRSLEEVETCIVGLQEEYNQKNKGIKLIHNNKRYQFVTNGQNREVVENFLKAELTGELTRPQLETLTIICYRGPISKPELEQIRGVNCSIILRNLIMRGLVESHTDKKIQLPKYQATMEFIKYLDLNDLRELPDYDKLSQHETLEELLDETSSGDNFTAEDSIKND